MGDVDYSLFKRELTHTDDVMHGLEKRGGGGHDGGMETRIERLERDMGDIKAILGRMEPVLSKINERLNTQGETIAELKGRIAQLPSTIQLIGFVIAVLVASGMLKHFLA